MNRLCNQYLNSENFNKDIGNEVVSSIIKSANDGDMVAVAAYSVMQLKGYGVEKNNIQARERLRSFAKTGEPYGLFLCGVLASDPWFEFSGDLFLSESHLRSVLFLDGGCGLSEEKIAVSASILGYYYSGECPLFEQDDVESYRMYSKAAENGDVDSMVKIGCILLDGVDGIFDNKILKDESRGVALLMNAGEKGSKSALVEMMKYHLKKAMVIGSSVDGEGDVHDIMNVLSSVEWMI